jgi:beta-phosphoglucomutase-like phosphatase (HAD superfamily)
VPSLPAGLRAHLDLVVFDLAGTTIDFGCKAPISAFVGLFAERGVVVTEAQARRPMGLAKRAHIDAMLSDPEVIAAWRARLYSSVSRLISSDALRVAASMAVMRLACSPAWVSSSAWKRRVRRLIGSKRASSALASG